MGKSKSKSKAARVKKPKKSKVEWSNSELDVLRSYEEKWFLLSSPEDRNTLAYGSIAEDLRRLSPEKYGVQAVLQRRELQAEWDKKCSQIKAWYKRKRPAAKERRIFKFERRIALRTVVGHTKSEAIKQAVLKKLPDDKKEDQQEYFKLYQRSVTEVMGQLSKKEKKQYEAVRDEWQAEGPPADVQAKNAQRYGYRCIEEMHKVANKQFGMLMITYSARPTKNGGWEYFIHDYNQNLNVPEEPILPMTSWAKSECRSFGKQFAKWVGYTDEAKSGHVSEENSRSAETRQGSVFKLQTTESGLPLLPAPILSSSGTEYFGTKREILRDFFVQHYRLATGKPSSRVPWGAMNQNIGQFIRSQFIPAGVIINDPGRMNSTHVSILLEHLRDRQQVEGIPTFLFHQIKKQDDTLADVEYPADALDDNEKAFESRTRSPEPSGQQDAQSGTSEKPIGSDSPPVQGLPIDSNPVDSAAGSSGNNSSCARDSGDATVRPGADLAAQKYQQTSRQEFQVPTIEASTNKVDPTREHQIGGETSQYAPGTTLCTDEDYRRREGQLAQLTSPRYDKLSSGLPHLPTELSELNSTAPGYLGPSYVQEYTIGVQKEPYESLGLDPGLSTNRPDGVAIWPNAHQSFLASSIQQPNQAPGLSLLEGQEAIGVSIGVDVPPKSKKRKRSNTGNQDEGIIDQAEQSGRATRSKTGSLNRGNSKPKSFSSGPKVAAGKRWKYVTDSEPEADLEDESVDQTEG